MQVTQATNKQTNKCNNQANNAIKVPKKHDKRYKPFTDTCQGRASASWSQSNKALAGEVHMMGYFFDNFD